MSQFLQIVSALREHMHATISRSDVLKALVWPMGILMVTVVGLVAYSAPSWLLIVLTVLLVLNFLLYGAAYIFCLATDRDALRSETYSLHKLAIEHGLYGDSRTGLIAPAPSANTPGSLSAPIIEASKEPSDEEGENE